MNRTSTQDSCSQYSPGISGILGEVSGISGGKALGTGSSPPLTKFPFKTFLGKKFMEASENSIPRHPRKETLVVGFGYVRMQLSRSQQGFLTSTCAGHHAR